MPLTARAAPANAKADGSKEGKEACDKTGSDADKKDVSTPAGVAGDGHDKTAADEAAAAAAAAGEGEGEGERGGSSGGGGDGASGEHIQDKS